MKTVDEQMETALLLIAERHKGQVDKEGLPYVRHCLYVAMHVKTEKQAVVGLMHDLVEDTKTTLDELRDLGFDEEIVVAVDYLTRRNGESYDAFIERIKENDIAVAVKIVDLKHNSQIKRIPNPEKKDFERVEKYKRALDNLRAHKRKTQRRLRRNDLNGKK
jgi:(p)ppGpp synthase/HD superfamily hydrolase